jgi:hypothetical protein
VGLWIGFRRIVSDAAAVPANEDAPDFGSVTRETRRVAG